MDMKKLDTDILEIYEKHRGEMYTKEMKESFSKDIEEVAEGFKFEVTFLIPEHDILTTIHTDDHTTRKYRYFSEVI